MNKQNNAGPAFPTPEVNERWSDRSYFQQAQSGMSLRDYFAAKALQGLLADSEVKAAPYEFATHAYEIADAMLEARGE